MEFDPAQMRYSDRYKLMLGAVQPRPIAWVSSLSPDGLRNLAPYSFFTAVCPEPPTIVFCPNVRSLTHQPKDTLSNIRATGEFVVNIVSEHLAEKMNLTSVEAPPEVDEFEFAGLTPLPSKIVKPPRVGESLVQLECKLHQIVDIGDQPGQGSLVIGTIVYFHVDDSVYIPDFKIDTHKLQPIGRLAGMDYSRTRDIFELKRPPALIKSGS